MIYYLLQVTNCKTKSQLLIEILENSNRFRFKEKIVIKLKILLFYDFLANILFFRFFFNILYQNSSSSSFMLS